MDTQRKRLEELRSQRWFAPDDMRSFAHRQRLQQMGLRREEFMSRPAIAIINTWSDLSPCHAHLRERAESVKRGILQAGGMPFELPAMSLGEVMVKPTTMLYRNFLAMEVEELLRSLPIDGAVLMGGCDKTTPGLLMGALSADLPCIFVPAGPMLNDRHRGMAVGAGTHTKKFWDEYQAGNIDQTEWVALEARMTRAPGTCNTMGTASTMTSIAEAMGFTLPGATSIPAMDAAHVRMASASGARIVDMVWEDLRPSRFFSERSVANGVATYMALGGSTNAAIHLIAIAGRGGVKLTLDEIDRLGGGIPVLANVFPSGDRLMEDFYYAGGLPALLQQIGDRLNLDCVTVNGRTLGENLADARRTDEQTVRSCDDPVTDGRALAVLRGNLAPSGAVIKPSAASKKFLKHVGPALVFDSIAEMNARIHDPDLDVDETTVLVLRNGGPRGAPGMPEWGNLPIPRKLLAAGVRDMVRLSDARMSGTHYGTCVLHIAPEAAVGGPLALIETGDIVELDVEAGRLDVRVSDEELARRRADWRASVPTRQRGYTRIYLEHVKQADEGCDFDFLMGTETPVEPSIY
ncbi:L-arabinonate dehydratase [Burkholderia multivorans]|uniref:L-arabinonate dehydratase n=2 Tax=Burkholderia multivorans TaxID=87883 RepID=UPI0019D16F7D|nr:L-arabinonate dehydratase [Burkholderia multivorans]MBN6738831.1 dihydroxy-acid dehydratase [Burkholderia multivorans]MBN7130104.1 dihydroxy-acid dehydratase [Burkholderia multivorans]MBN8173461.1 dihydroxy-acid dehydratase [Burkholderia multivorans]QSL29415.1 dihydroxy-acid dehydratase [Burkholderia multivorans]